VLSFAVTLNLAANIFSLVDVSSLLDSLEKSSELSTEDSSEVCSSLDKDSSEVCSSLDKDSSP
jgi:hypothetical protein